MAYAGQVIQSSARAKRNGSAWRHQASPGRPRTDLELPSCSWWLCHPRDFYAVAKIEAVRIMAADRSKVVLKDITQ